MSSPQPSLPRRFAPLGIALVGFAIASYLQFVHYRSYTQPDQSSVCGGSGSFDCTAVTQSAYSVFLGLPFSIWGVVLYVAIALAARRNSILLLPLAAIAALGGVVLTVLQLAVIGAICWLCESVHLTSLVLFGTVLYLRQDLKNDLQDPSTWIESAASPAVIVGIVFFALPPYWQSITWSAAPPYETGQTAQGDRWLGAKVPVIRIEEYTDYKCPHCRIGSTRTLRLVGKYQPMVRVIRKHHPRMRCDRPGTIVCQTLRVALCAAEQGKFWQMDRWLFEHAAGRPKVDPDEAATDVGLDAERLKACMARPETYKAAHAHFVAAKKRMVDETPAYFVNGRRVPSGELDKVVAKKLQR